MIGVFKMYELNRLSQVFGSAEEIPFDDSSKIILMSDCHRGDGSWADDFSRNQNLFFAALTHYYNENYTYIEIGDGDELWKNSRFSDIMQVHSDVFWLMSKFYDEGRLHLIFGNHDIVKKSSRFVRNNCRCRFAEREKRNITLFDNIKFHEGLILKHAVTGDEIFLVHGHQADYMNDRLWMLSRFLVRHIWRPLELHGVNDPTSAARNYQKKEAIDRILLMWVKGKNQMLIAGHTHRPMFPAAGEPPYFNDGSCVHPRCITGIEIADGCIMLVKWCVKTKDDGTLFVGREVLAGPTKLQDYFNTSAVLTEDPALV